MDELKSQLYRGLDVGCFTQAQFGEFYMDADTIDRKTTTFIITSTGVK